MTTKRQNLTKNSRLCSQEQRFVVFEEKLISGPESVRDVYESHIKILSPSVEKDSGNYTCMIENFQAQLSSSSEIHISVLPRDESQIEIEEPTGTYRFFVRQFVNLRITANVEGYPKPTTFWLDRNGDKIETRGNYDVSNTNFSTLLKITKPTLNDFGNYTLVAENGIISKSKVFEVIVNAKPTLKKSESEIYVKVGDDASMSCEVRGYPPSKIDWIFQPCFTKSKCANQTISDANIETVQHDFITQISRVKLAPMQSGLLYCNAENDQGAQSAPETEVVVGDLEKPFIAWSNEGEIVAEGDSVTLTCGIAVNKYKPPVQWFFNDQLAETLPGNFTCYFESSIELMRNFFLLMQMRKSKPITDLYLHGPF